MIPQIPNSLISETIYKFPFVVVNYLICLGESESIDQNWKLSRATFSRN